MLVSIPDFWKLAIDSRLLAAEHCQQLAATYEQTKGPLAQANAATLADWLVAINVLSKYQAMVLLNGRSGPFYYGEYKVYDRVESGRWKGFFRAVHAPTNHPVLLQFATGAITQDPQQWAFVVGQVHNRLAAAFPHWHRYYEVVDLGNFKFLVAEDLQGDTVEARLGQVGRIAPADACVVVRHAALALAQLHRWQMPHGDVRPANLWLDAHGHCRLLQDPTMIPSPFPQGVSDPEGLLAARADYAAPELSQPGRMPDPQTDIYALGCCFFQMLTGRPPFAGGDVASKFQRHHMEPIASLAPLGIPEPLSQLVAFMLAKNPATRYPQAQIVADQLAPFVDPARLQATSVAVVPTLPGYEQFVQQRGVGRTSPAYLTTHTAAGSNSSVATPAPTVGGGAANVAGAGATAAGPSAGVSTPGHVASSAPGAAAATPPPPPPPPLPVAPKTSQGQAEKKATVATSPGAKPVAGGATSAGAPPTPGAGAAKPGAPKPTPVRVGAAVGPPTAPGQAAGGHASGAAASGKGPVAPVPAGGSQGGSREAVRPVAVAGTAGMRPPAAMVAGPVPASSATAANAQRAGNPALLWGGIGGGVLLLVVIVVVIAMSMGDGGGSGPGGTATAENSASGTPTSAGAGGVATQVNPVTSVNPVNPGSGKIVGGGMAKTNGATTGSGAGVRPGGTATSPAVATSQAPQQIVVPDDGKSLWESPTSGAPIELQWVPPGGQVFLMVRPHDMLATTEGPRVLRALGPAVETHLAAWEKAAGVKFAEVDSLLMTLHDNGEEFPRPSFVVRLDEPLDASEWAGKWNAQEEGESDRASLFSAGSWLYCIPKQADNRLFVMGAKEDIEEVAKIGGSPPALRREIDRLRRMTDSQRHVTLLLAPNYLGSTMFRDGRSFYFGEAKKLREPLDWFLRDELQGALFSLHMAGDTYLELRLTSNLNKDRFTLAKEFQDRLEQVPDLAFDYIATLGSNPYWERVRLQFPNMIRFLHGKTRIGVEEDTATINARLPGPAAHNLLFGSEMVLMSQPGAIPVAAASKPMPMAGNMGGLSPGSMTIDDVLSKYKTNVSFEAMSIEHALMDLAKGVNEELKGLPFEFKIKVAGEDLRLDGITRNQTVRDFMQKDKSIGEILTAMVMKANPVTTVKEPSEKDQKLLWVIEKDPEDPAKTIVLVTTRQVSEQKGYKLPAVFQLK